MQNFTNILKRNIHKAVVLGPRLAMKPVILRRWLMGAHYAQVALLLFILVMPRFIPSVVDTQLEKMYPPKKIKNLFGLTRRTKADPRLKERMQQARVFLWGSGGSLVFLLFFLQLPKAIRQTMVLARKYEDEADTVIVSEPFSSRGLYHKALSLTIDAAYEKILHDKLKPLNESLFHSDKGQVAVTAASTSQDKGTGTVVLQAGDALAPNSVASKPLAKDGTISGTGVGSEGRFQIKEEIGRGGMGVVYRGYDQVLDREVALKRVPDFLDHNQDQVLRFRQEAKALARLNHPHIVQIYDFVQDGEQTWIAMEFVEGEDLSKTCFEALSLNETARLCTALAEALAYAHSQGVIHRDFKPANVLLTQGGLPKITDFGVAKIPQSTLQTKEGSVLGSPAYMSPEQALGKETDERSDIYALGVLLYKILAGRFPFEGDVAGVIAQKITAAPTPLPEEVVIPETLKLLVMQMLAKESADRPSSMDAVAEVLKMFSTTNIIDSPQMAV